MTNSTSSNDNKLMLLLIYIISPLVPFIFLLMDDKKNDPALRIHIFQSLILGILVWVTSWMFGVGFLIAIYMLYLGIQAYQGKDFTIPFLTDFCKQQGWA